MRGGTLLKRKQVLFCVAVLSMLSLTGCMEIKELTEQQSDLVAEYSAGILLKYSDRYERRLITKEQLKKDEKQGATATPTATVSVTPTPTATGDLEGEASEGKTEQEVPDVSLNDFYHFNGVDVSYDSCKFVNQYGAAYIRAEKGETLCVVSFSLHNTSSKVKKLNLMKRMGISYTLDVDGSEYQPGPSILLNGGMNQLKTTLKPGQKEKAVLIYRMAKSKKNASSITLTISEGKRETTITIKK